MGIEAGNTKPRRLTADAIWRPGVVVANQVAKSYTVSEDARVLPSDGTVTLTRIVKIQTTADFDHRNFPFDEHNIVINLESFQYGPEDLKFIKDPSAERMTDLEQLDGAIWSLKKWSLVPQLQLSQTGEEDWFMIGTLTIKRQYSMVASTLISPMVLIVLFTFSAFFVSPENLMSVLPLLQSVS